MNYLTPGFATGGLSSTFPGSVREMTFVIILFLKNFNVMSLDLRGGICFYRLLLGKDINVGVILSQIHLYRGWPGGLHDSRLEEH